MKHYELVELEDGNVVAVGPFKDQADAQAFAEFISAYDNPLPIGSRGGVQAVTMPELADRIGVKTSVLTAYRNGAVQRKHGRP